MDLQKLVGFFIPDGIEDQNQKTTDFKLALGATAGLSLIAGSFLILAGFFQLVTEDLAGFSVSNATIFIFIGVAVVWFTLTKIGVKHADVSNQRSDNNKN